MMDMSSPARRSSRQRKENKKYANHGWDKKTLKLLRESSESSNPTSPDTLDDEVEDVDEEFSAADAQVLEDDAEIEEDALSIQSGRSSASSIATPGAQEEDVVSDASSGGQSRTNLRGPRKPGERSKTWAQQQGLRSRGQHGHDKLKIAQHKVYTSIFGPELDDLQLVLLSRDMWHLQARDITFPSRRTLNQATKVFEIMYANLLGSEIPETAQTPRVADDLHLSRQRQETSPINMPSLLGKLYMCPGDDQEIVMGPWKRQSKFKIPFLEAIDIAGAWPMKPSSNNSQSVNHPSSEPFTSTPHASYRNGWLLNLGEKIQCLAWAPQQVSKQYLAVACRCTSRQRQQAPPTSGIRAPAFSQSGSYPSCVQIWSFGVSGSSATETWSMDMSQTPKLVTVLCTRWGNIRQMEWAPPETLSSNTGDIAREIGRLGVIASDGSARLLHVDVNEDGSCLMLQVEEPEISFFPPPDTVFTCLAFATESDLLVGGANGHVRIYNIRNRDGNGFCHPYMIYQLHNTYIMSLCVVFDLPHFLASTSAAGDLLLTDLRCPEQERVSVHKARVPTANLAYIPFTRSFVSTSDSAGNSESKGSTQSTLICHHLRQFYSTVTIARLPEASGTATSVAASKWHPCVLTSNAEGTVFATNIVRRLLPGSRKDKRGTRDGWIQKLCEYEWRPLLPTTSTGAETQDDTTTEDDPPPAAPEIDLFHGLDTRPGLSRFQEGFKPEKINLNPLSKRRTGAGSGADSTTQVIFDEEQAVTATCWNPNRLCCAWAAIGWGSGLVRVQDLSHDMV